MGTSPCRLVARHALVTSLVMVVLAGCAPAEDRSFRAMAADVLRQASTLESHADAYLADRDHYVAADSVIARFKVSVAALPAPKARDLRYLCLRLVQLGEAAEDLRGSQRDGAQAAANIPLGRLAGQDPAFMEYMRYHGARQATFWKALGVVAAAEHVILGTSRLEDQARARWIGLPGDSTSNYGRESDSSLVATEKIVRRDIARIK